MKEHSVKLLAVCEDQSSIVDWAERVFGPPSSAMAVAAHANVEMAELLRIMAHNSSVPLKECAHRHRMGAAEAAAGIMIQLYRLAQIGSFDLLAAVDHRMRMNRQRHQAECGGKGEGARS